MLEPRDEFSGAKIIPLLTLWLADVGCGSTQGEGAPGLGDEEARCTAALAPPAQSPSASWASSLSKLSRISFSPSHLWDLSLFKDTVIL